MNRLNALRKKIYIFFNKNLIAGGATASSTAAAAGHSPDTPNQDDGISLSRQAYDLEEEKSLPGVLMANNADIFNKLYKLANMEDGKQLLFGRKKIIKVFNGDSLNSRIFLSQYNYIENVVENALNSKYMSSKKPHYLNIKEY